MGKGENRIIKMANKTVQFEIKRQALLVTIEMGEVEAKVRVRRKIAVRIALRRRFDFDHAGAEITQERSGVRTRNECGAFNDSNVI